MKATTNCSLHLPGTSSKPYTDCDSHSQLNQVSHRRRVEVTGVDALERAIQAARQEHTCIVMAGGRHSMGGQQFASGGILLDTRPFNRVLAFDGDRGLITVQPGIMWSQLIEQLHRIQHHRMVEKKPVWTIVQKPTGADNISIGGSLSSNIHGRGLKFKPFVQDIEAFEILKADGNLLTVNRRENAELFRLAIGGYGLFGLVTSVTIRLKERKVMRRVVESTNIGELIECFNRRIRDGHEYGDFQFAIDPASSDFLNKGILATYIPEDIEMPSSAVQTKLGIDQWKELLYLAHVDKTNAFTQYEAHYRKTNGQLYYSDTMQLSTYLEDYHSELDARTGAPKATEVITELYVPRNSLATFMQNAAVFLKKENADIVYGTVRLIEQDDETFLAWAKQDYACVIFNLHTEHDEQGRDRSARAFTGLIDLAQALGGSFYLTYHRHAQRSMLERSYPQFPLFLEQKLKYDEEELIQSEWYRHYRDAV